MIDINNERKKRTNAIVFDSNEDWNFPVQKYMVESNLWDGISIEKVFETTERINN